MYCLIDFCSICFDSKEHLQPLSGFDSDNITYLIKLTSFVPEMCFNQMNNKRLICNKCCKTMDAAYKFRQRCLRSKATLTDYFLQLHQFSNICGTATVYLTDINKITDIKKAYQNQNNINVNEILIKLYDNVNKKENSENNHDTKIKSEISQFTSKLIDIDHQIQFENVGEEINRKDQFSEVNVESFDNPLINQNENKTDVTHNDIITASAIKKENENFEENLQEKFENILCDSENDDLKIRENYDYSLYPEKYSVDPLTNFEEIKIDMDDNNELAKDKINIQCKNEGIKEFKTEDNGISLETQDEDNTDKEINYSHESFEEEPITTSFNKEQQLKCGLNNQKVKIIKNHKCTICKQTFIHLISLINHMKIHIKETPNQCEICHKQFTRPHSLTVHKRIHSGVKPYSCDVCRKKFSQLIHLRGHMKIHTGSKPEECEVCQKKINQSINLDQHIKIDTKFDAQKKLSHLMTYHISTHIEDLYECDICHKKYKQSAYLKTHMKIHTGEKQHQCDVCQKKFSQSDGLKNHKRIHSGEKLHGCDLCEKKFTHLTTLRHHKRTHTGEKPYTCDVCKKTFAQLGSLKQHKTIHSGLKPHRCEVCEKTFSQIYYLTRHMKTHTEETRFNCDLCQKKFNHLCNLKKHKNEHCT